jgi:hypothetical protein
MPILAERIGTTEGAPHFKAGGSRAARFFVRAFQLQGVQLSWLYHGEAQLIGAMLGAPIDPELLHAAPDVDAALQAIAHNTSVLVTGKLTACRRQPRSPALYPVDPNAEPIWPPVGGLPPRLAPRSPQGSAFALPPPALSKLTIGRAWAAAALPAAGPDALPAASLDSLPASVVQLILCFTGSSRAADALSCTCRSLAAPPPAAEPPPDTRSPHGSLAELFPVWSGPAQGSCPASVVAYDRRTGALRKTARLGNPIVLVGEPVFHSRRHGGLLELRIQTLHSVGGIQLGVVGLSKPQADAAMLASRSGGEQLPIASDRGASAAPDGAIRFWCDGAGRVRILDGPRCGVIASAGEAVREGDVLGAAVFPLRSRCYLALTLNDVLMGPPLPLPRRAAWRFYTFFDCVEGNTATVVGAGVEGNTSSPVGAGVEGSKAAMFGAVRRAPLALAALVASSRRYVPRPLGRGPRGGALVLVRTVGPVSRGVYVEIEGVEAPGDATVAQVACAVSGHVGCDAWPMVELRFGRNLTPLPSAGDAHAELPAAGATMTAGGRWGALRLRELGLSFHPATGTQSHDILASLPVLFS